MHVCNEQGSNSGLEKSFFIIYISLYNVFFVIFLKRQNFIDELISFKSINFLKKIFKLFWAGQNH